MVIIFAFKIRINIGALIPQFLRYEKIDLVKISYKTASSVLISYSHYHCRVAVNKGLISCRYTYLAGSG